MINKYLFIKINLNLTPKSGHFILQDDKHGGMLTDNNNNNNNNNNTDLYQYIVEAYCKRYMA